MQNILRLIPRGEVLSGDYIPSELVRAIDFHLLPSTSIGEGMSFENWRTKQSDPEKISAVRAIVYIYFQEEPSPSVCTNLLIATL
jgi:hypothetical protein